ncbi:MULTISPECIES: ComF family protein [Cyanophyceae]|uniref:ComF family protein n=1 Tax=Leptolyngbya subtilissima DQ-A4 TaxID=2933933 RepID=A0ABV0K219_9CYAN|nr:ComF family protein [Nodosilinea sp. FACHB-141]MBD2111599.1 ComF family protein [Nodosilinea sp. FACHB-141]
MHRRSSVQTWLSQGKRQMLSLFLAEPCPLCQRATPAVLCPSCCRQVQQCQAPTPCDRSIPDLTVLSWGRYEDSLRQVIGSLKYSGHTGLAQFLGTELGQTWLDHNPQSRASSRPVAIVPIPLHPTRLQQRGFNQADLIGQWFCRLTGLPLYSHGLLRVQSTQAQHSLNRLSRQQNLAQAFAVAPAHIKTLQRSTVWLLDDIFTTGATAQSAAQVLRRSGIAVEGICTVARPTIWATPIEPKRTSPLR